ncbi:6-phosphofructokinase 5, chloroplastic [Auxenochlorella protothecoides]|uniref:6-phosphofructokinase 5, chloroplastic n=1 Tax=Auxenochlorella protothecoides TaxID=3075 RepID=A0A087SL69_AUXPR|nr:6-phosphofructokinase 5, chloroplastic [Auxenochlorella protothecoides]KFM26473.1 6-phosphofructokinase 5, chloroplastic [Auxenochlorella protothecoides]
MAGAATHRSHGENPASEASQPEASTQRDLAASEGATRASAPLKSNPSIPVTVRSDGLQYLEVKDLRSVLKPRKSPFCATNNAGAGFVGDTDLVRIGIMEYESSHSSGAQGSGLYDAADNSWVDIPPYAIRSGPRESIYHDPKQVTAALVTCGGLCPGLNDVVQNIVYTLEDHGVPEDQIFGIRFGLRGFLDRHTKPIMLSRAAVEGIQLKGGTVLGTSRGNAKMHEIVDRLRLWGVNMLFVIGGNGGNAAAHAIARECERQGVVCNVVGVPKSIDNDIQLIDRCFGFDTAVEEAQRSLICARTEARSASGISIVKLMGRSSGFISLNASMASGVVDVCLIPEIPFSVPRLVAHVQTILAAKDYCVICVAEGAGQDVVQEGGAGGTDASGNPILKDIGTFLRDRFEEAIEASQGGAKGDGDGAAIHSGGNPDPLPQGIDVRYIDPSYMIRSIPTITTDRIYCKVLSQGAVHGAFAGYTDFTVGLVNTHYVYLPTTTIIQSARTVDPAGRQWNRLKTAINQPDLA